jgi:hypothetical protein
MMNSNWKRNFMVIAVAVAASGVVASAQQLQDVKMNASIPFAFSIGNGATLAPGNYTVTRHGNVWRFTSEDYSETAPIVSYVALKDQAGQTPSLTFACAREHCQVRAIHAGSEVLGAQVPAPKLSQSDQDELAVVSVKLLARN